VSQDNDKRLHNTERSAIAFADGYELFFVRGVEFTKELFGKAFISKTLTCKDVLSLSNSEQKAILLQFCLPFESLRKIDNYQEIDSLSVEWNNTGNFINYVLFSYELDDVLVKNLRVEWFEKGNKRETILGIDPNEPLIVDVVSAWCWTFPVAWEDYKKQLVDKNNFKEYLEVEA
jgi:hypothetical protein